MLRLPDVTLIMVDCVDYARAHRVFEFCQSLCDFGACKLLSHFDSVHDYDVKINKITGIEQYSHFMLHNLGNFFNTSHCLVIQHDGFIINPQAWTDEFLAYDYIGAPWPDPCLHWKGINFKNKYCVGNGGFSLRSKRLYAILGSVDLDVFHPEDVAICRIYRPFLEKLDIQFAPVSLAKRFGVEYGEVNDQFGQHGAVLLPNGNMSIPWFRKPFCYGPVG